MKLVGKGDYDTEALDAEAAELEALASSLEKKQDPYASRSGPMRRAYRSPAGRQALGVRALRARRTSTATAKLSPRRRASTA